MAISIAHQLAQLNEARNIVLGDAKLYPQIVEGILPIIGANARLELRRWGADFLAETFASPMVTLQMKETLGIRVLQTLKDLLELPGEDVESLKSVVQAAASIYALVFRYIINNPSDIPIWNMMAAIKSNILNRWDNTAPGVRICCIKFVQRVIQRPERNEISLALVPRDHPLIPPSKLEPQTSGLLDRLLNVFYEEPKNAMYLSATLTCLNVLLRTRPSISNKIISAILNFSPYQLPRQSTDSKWRMQVKSLEKTVRILLHTLLKRYEKVDAKWYARHGDADIYLRSEEGPMAGRIKVYIERLERSRLEMFAADTASRKRGLTSEPTDGLDASKRRRLGAEVPKQNEPPPLQPGPNSYAQLYTLTDDSGLASFGVWQIPQDLVTRATVAILAHIDSQSLDAAINHVRSRYLTLDKEANRASKIQEGLPEDEEDEYEPDFEPSEDKEQIQNKQEASSAEDISNEVALGPFTFPQPAPLSADEAEREGQGTINRVFGMMNDLDDASTTKRQRPGLNRLAGSSYDRDAWLTIITRLATRGDVDFDEGQTDGSESSAMVKRGQHSKLSNGIRETLWRQVLEDFRARIGVAIAWLNEEWFNEQIQTRAHKKPPTEDEASSTQAQQTPSSSDNSHAPMPTYDYYALKLLDGILPYLDARDHKILIRFLSEIPTINPALLTSVKSLAKDPERIDLAVKAIHYLILMKPPAREICLDAIEDLWRNYDGAQTAASKVLAKWRPGILPSTAAPVSTPTGSGTAKVEKASGENGKMTTEVSNEVKPPPSAASGSGPSDSADSEKVDKMIKEEQTGTALAAAAG